jgi:tetratricopeptide (TPR) repeat protein
MFKYIFLLIILFSTLIQSQTKTIDELGKFLIGIIQAENNKSLMKIQATPDIYRQVAPSQMKGKTDDEVMEIVNSGVNSLTNKVDNLRASLKEVMINPAGIKFKKVIEKKYDFIKLDWKIFEAVYSFEKVTDTLVIEVKGEKQGFYLIDIANDDKEFSNFVTKKGKVDYKFYFNKGMLAKQNEEWKSAVKYFGNAINLNPNDNWSYFELAYAFVELKEYKEAEQVLLKGDKIKGDLEYKQQIWLELGYVYSKLDEADKAIEYYNKIIQSDKNTYFPHYHIGTIEYSRMNYSKATVAFDKAITNNTGNYYQPYFMKAMSEFRLKNYENSIEYFVKTLELNDQHKEVMYNLGWVYNELGYYTRAIDIYQTLISLDPSNNDALYEFAYANQKSDLTDKALTYYLKVEQNLIKSNDPGINKGVMYKHIGECYEVLDQKNKACDYFRLAKENGADVPDELFGRNCK